MYQTVSSASAANAATGRGGVNSKQIGLGVAMGATKITITNPGSAESTGDGLDVRLIDKVSTNFFVVSNGSQNLFTRAGSFYIDGAGNLAMTTTGYTVMGWQVDENTGIIRKDTVSPLRVMQEKNLTSMPEATSKGTVGGIMDINDSNVASDAGYTMSLNFFDRLGYSYTAKFSAKIKDAATKNYTVELTDILDSENRSILNKFLQGGGQMASVFGRNTTRTKAYPIADSSIKYFNDDQAAASGGANGVAGAGFYKQYTSYSITDGSPITMYVAVTVDEANNSYEVGNYTRYPDGDTAKKDAGVGDLLENVAAASGTLTDLFGITAEQLNAGAAGGTTGKINTDTDPITFDYTEPAVNYDLKFNPDDGSFSYVGAQGSDTVTLKLAETFGNNFSDIEIDFSSSLEADNGGKTTLGADPGWNNGTIGGGKALGVMIGLSINNNGMIYGSYDNGNTMLLGQIAVAQFANASGLEKVGENCYTTTLNSGDFDGIGVEVAADGSGMSAGELEMSNVDLSTEFTQMIITQRGFQSNSRIITVSDTLIEELVNLKR